MFPLYGVKFNVFDFVSDAIETDDPLIREIVELYLGDYRKFKQTHIKVAKIITYHSEAEFIRKVLKPFELRCEIDDGAIYGVMGFNPFLDAKETETIGDFKKRVEETILKLERALKSSFENCSPFIKVEDEDD